MVGTDRIRIGEGPPAVSAVAALADRVRFDRANGVLYVREEARAPVLLMDATGRQMGHAFGPVARFATGELPAGVYIIRASGLSERVVVE